MKHKFMRRALSIASAAVLGVAALAMFAGCDTRYPEVTVTYSFNGKTYAVDYTLSRNDAPQTVQHFIELADAGYYDGMVVHDYTDSALHTGGYRLADGELEEENYFERVRQIEAEQHKTFTQSVWKNDEARTPLYTVYGEFEQNGVAWQYGRDNYYSQGALVMYYTEKGGNDQVVISRADGGAGDNGEAYNVRGYKYNSATSLFYTVTGTGSSGSEERSYCVFGKATKYNEQMRDGLLAAINEYIETLDGDEADFTQTIVKRLNQNDPFETVATEGRDGTFHTPVQMPIVIQSVKVNKY